MAVHWSADEYFVSRGSQAPPPRFLLRRVVQSASAVTVQSLTTAANETLPQLSSDTGIVPKENGTFRCQGLSWGRCTQKGTRCQFKKGLTHVILVCVIGNVAFFWDSYLFAGDWLFIYTNITYMWLFSLKVSMINTLQRSLWIYLQRICLFNQHYFLNYTHTFAQRLFSNPWYEHRKPPQDKEAHG